MLRFLSTLYPAPRSLKPYSPGDRIGWELDEQRLEADVRTKISRFFNGMAQYTLKRSYDDTAGIAAFPANQYD